MAEGSKSSLTAAQVRGIIKDVLSGFEKPENKAKFKDIKDRAGNNLVKLLEETFPAAMEIQQEVIRSHGFSPDQEGLLKFTQAVQSFEREDPEIARLATELKNKFIPPMPRPPVFIPQNVQ